MDPPSASSTTSLPILTISILGILTTAILLLSYYIFVIKCSLNRDSSDMTRSELSRSPRQYSTENRGLDESAIRAIPTFRLRRGDRDGEGKESFHECAVCLNDFQEEERIRLLPNCCHVFHIDCIDTWLQTNTNCPLCRSGITTTNTTTPIPTDHFMAQTIHQSPQYQREDAVIDVEGDLTTRRKLQHVCSMGDECIDVRTKDEQFYVHHPMRRSFSMDSSRNRQLCLAVQEIMQQNPHCKEAASGEGCSSSGGSTKAWRPFFVFSHCRRSRNAVLPIKIGL